MSTANIELLRLTVDVWHPDCWTLHATESTDTGLLGHGITTFDAGAAERFTAYGDSTDEIAALVDAIRSSDPTKYVAVADTPSLSPETSARVTHDLFVTFDPTLSIESAFTSQGFVYYRPTRMENGRERWSLLAHTDRQTIKRLLEDIETTYDADIELTRLTSVSRGNPHNEETDMETTYGFQLSPRQREAFQVAREHGYYRYPRETTARDLAVELDISKTTFLEHLRKAEAKLLSDIDLG